MEFFQKINFLFLFSEPHLDIGMDAVLTSFKNKLARPKVMEATPSNEQDLTNVDSELKELLGFLDG